MPSDCQCSSSRVEIKEVIKVIGSKTAGRRIERLENEVEALTDEVRSLKHKLTKANASKKKIVRDLKSKLDNM